MADKRLWESSIAKVNKEYPSKFGLYTFTNNRYPFYSKEFVYYKLPHPILSEEEKSAKNIWQFYRRMQKVNEEFKKTFKYLGYSDKPDYDDDDYGITHSMYCYKLFAPYQESRWGKRIRNAHYFYDNDYNDISDSFMHRYYYINYRNLCNHTRQDTFIINTRQCAIYDIIKGEQIIIGDPGDCGPYWSSPNDESDVSGWVREQFGGFPNKYYYSSGLNSLYGFKQETYVED